MTTATKGRGSTGRRRRRDAACLLCGTPFAFSTPFGFDDDEDSDEEPGLLLMGFVEREPDSPILGDVCQSCGAQAFVSLRPAQRIAATIEAIPWGKVLTYGMVAGRIGRPEKESRIVADVLRRKPHMPGWHHVIGKVPRKSNRGRITVPDAERAWLQRKRLEREGVRFDDADHIDLSRFAAPLS